MIGTIVNTIAVIAGGSLGLMLKKGLPERYQNVFFQVIGLVTLSLGITMVYNVQHLIIVIASLVSGTFLGTWCNVEHGVERFGNLLKRKINIGSEKFSEGFITAFLLFCIGSMTILGAIQEGTGVSSDLLYTKSMLDFFSSIILASAFGIGILFAAIPLFLFQASITLLAMQASTFFSPEIINGLTSIGGIMLLGLGINILEIKKIPIANMLPALVIVCFLIWVLPYLNL